MQAVRRAENVIWAAHGTAEAPLRAIFGEAMLHSHARELAFLRVDLFEKILEHNMLLGTCDLQAATMLSLGKDHLAPHGQSRLSDAQRCANYSTFDLARRKALKLLQGDETTSWIQVIPLIRYIMDEDAHSFPGLWLYGKNGGYWGSRLQCDDNSTKIWNKEGRKRGKEVYCHGWDQREVEKRGLVEEQVEFETNVAKLSNGVYDTAAPLLKVHTTVLYHFIFLLRLVFVALLPPALINSIIGIPDHFNPKKVYFPFSTMLTTNFAT